MRKIYILLLLFVFFSFPLSAFEYKKMGIGLDSSLYNIHDVNQNDSKANDLAFTIKSTLSIMKNELFEITPYLLFGLNSESEDGEALERYFTIGAGAGLHFHIFRTKYFRFATGFSFFTGCLLCTKDPAFDKDFTLKFTGSLPLIIEITPNQHLSLRTSMDIARMELSYRMYDYGGGQQSRLISKYDVIIPFSELALGIFFRFN